MAIAYKDFPPVLFKKRGFLSNAQFGPLNITLQRANQWLVESGVDVINIETVVLPNVADDEDSSKGGILALNVVNWVQVIRVWYHAEPPRGQ